MSSKKSKALVPLFPESFKAARSNFSRNLSALLKHLGYTESTLALKLTAVCSSDPVASLDVYDWVAGTKLPNVYHLYKLSTWLRVPMDSLFLNKFNAEEVIGRSFASQPITYSLTEEPLKQVTTPVVKPMENQMATNKSSIVSISRNSKKQMEQIVTARTSSKTYNLLLANKLYNTDMQLKEIATKVGASTRSLRDYAFYGTTVPSAVAEKLVKLFKTSYRNLGLQYNNDKDRYEHMSVKIKA